MPRRKTIPSNIKTSDIGSIYKRSLEKKGAGRKIEFEKIPETTGKSDPSSEVYSWRSMSDEDRKKQNELDKKFFKTNASGKTSAPAYYPKKASGKIITRRSGQRPATTYQKGAETALSPSPTTHAKKTHAKETVNGPYECKVNVGEYLTKLGVEQRLGGTIHAYQVLLLLSGDVLTGYVGNGLFKKSDIESNPYIATTWRGYELKDSAKDILEQTRDGKFAAGTIMPTDYAKAHLAQMRKAIEAENRKRSA